MALKYLTDIDLNQNELQNGVIQNVSGNVSTPKAGQIWFDSSNGVKKLKYYDGTNTLIIGESSISSSSTSQSVPTTQAIAEYVGGAIAAMDAMVFKGTLGTGGTITALPTTYSTGWTYRVITAGTYAGNVCEVGDLIIALTSRSGSGNLNSDWTVAQTNIEGAITTADAASSTPVMDGTGAVGTSTKYAREDHVHPSDTSRVPTTRTVNGHALSSDVEVTNLDLGQAVGTCSVSGTSLTSAISNYKLTDYGVVVIKFTGNVPANATLNINSQGAKPIYWHGSPITEGIINTNDYATFIYNGTAYYLLTIDKSAKLASAGNAGLMSSADKALLYNLSVITIPAMYVGTNPALTASSGVCTWVIDGEDTGGIGDGIATVYEQSTHNVVLCDVSYDNYDYTIKIASSSNISANTYKVVIVGNNS